MQVYGTFGRLELIRPTVYSGRLSVLLVNVHIPETITVKESTDCASAFTGLSSSCICHARLFLTGLFQTHYSCRSEFSRSG